MNNWIDSIEDLPPEAQPKRQCFRNTDIPRIHYLHTCIANFYQLTTQDLDTYLLDVDQPLNIVTALHVLEYAIPGTFERLQAHLNILLEKEL